MSGIGGQQDVDIDLGGLFRAIWQRRVRVLLATVGAAAVAFGLPRWSLPITRARRAS